VALEQLASWVQRVTSRGQFSRAALSTLAALDRFGPQRISDLIARERITQPGMTSLVTRLAEAGFVERHPDPTDGRAALVAVTATGHAYLESVHAERAALLAEHLARLPVEQQAAIHAAIDGVTALASQPIVTKEEGPAS
jgi:DNA-binding MarR family transcriptional regulator